MFRSDFPMLLAAAKAAGATGAAIRYGEMVTKVFFVPQGAEEPQVTDKMKELQLATAQQRIDELQKRTKSQQEALDRLQILAQKAEAAQRELAAEGEGKKVPPEACGSCTVQ